MPGTAAFQRTYSSPNRSFGNPPTPSRRPVRTFRLPDRTPIGRPDPWPCHLHQGRATLHKQAARSTGDAAWASSAQEAGPNPTDEGSAGPSVPASPRGSDLASSASRRTGTPRRHRTTRNNRRAADVEPLDELGSLDERPRPPRRKPGKLGETFPDRRRTEAHLEPPQGFHGVRRASTAAGVSHRPPGGRPVRGWRDSPPLQA